ncbi:hypothetical protein [Deinococcus xianganensis]|uniref:DUF4333 domain-containing protein n=1 Tax=Deinococcus xianganensis TaxID=1507289 RepID=A0A6I4Y9B1_9DEIO|nr:hypothetical protein [Deinococcus xianganensis]MXV18979.1 hypothetical protein [Deinococcus xianganensis]
MSPRPRPSAQPSAQPTVRPGGPGLRGDGELREVTPEMRARGVRTFVTVLVVFFALVGVVVATLAWQGRGVRDYAARVADAVLAGKPSPNVGFTRPCGEVVPGPLPAQAQSCEVRVEDGAARVTVGVQGGRSYVIERRP